MTLQRLKVATLLASLAIAGCVSDSELGAKGPTSEDIWQMSGTKDAVVALQQSLSDACHVSLGSPDSYQKVSPEADTCIRSKVVMAFDAQEGTLICGRDRNLQQFVSCILEGQFVGHVIDNTGSERLAPDLQWGGGEERGRKASSLLTDRARASCATPDQAAMKQCVEAALLKAFEIDSAAVGFCPSQKQRDLCMYWAGFARSIRIKLDRIGI